MVIGPPDRRISCRGGKAPLRRPLIRCCTHSNSSCHRVLAGSASSQRGAVCPGVACRQRAGPEAACGAGQLLRRAGSGVGTAYSTPRLRRGFPSPARWRSTRGRPRGRALRRSRRARECGPGGRGAPPEGRCADPLSPPGSERGQHRHQFPSRGGEAVVVPRRAGLVLQALENARRDRQP
jgi:hypothetical protein